MSDLILTGEPAATPAEDPARIWGHIFDMGLRAGRSSAGNEEVITQLLDAALGCMLDESQPDDLREKAFANCIGFATGYREMMLVTPLQFLTREQTARVQALPRGVRRAWLAEYRKGVKRWVNAGGTLSGRRPILPSIPGLP